MTAIARLVRRLSILFGGTATALVHFGCLWLRYGGMPPLKRRAEWLHSWCAWAVPKLGIELATRGRAPGRGLLIANHLSYLDILVLSATSPAVFVAKSEVRSWPVFGWMARLEGAIFIRRSRLRDLPIVIGQMRAALESGVQVVLFPEGTTSDGSVVLPFKPALFEPAVCSRGAVTPVAMDYQLEAGDASREVCWWGEMTLLPHLLKLLTKPRIDALVEFCSAPHVWRNRKVAALLTREQIAAMKDAISNVRRPEPQAILEAALDFRAG